MAEYVKTTDDGLEVYQDRDLSSSVIARPVTGADIELGAATMREGRQWLEAKVGGIAGYVLAPNVRGHTTLGGPTTAAFVGEMYYSYYERKWAGLAGRNRFSWNWAAFFLGPIWLAYRKMYGYAAAFLGITWALGILAIVFKWQPQYSSTASVAVSWCIGRSGNYWYKEHVIKRVATAGPDEVHRLAEEGGTSVLASLVFAGALSALSVTAALLARA